MEAREVQRQRGVSAIRCKDGELLAPWRAAGSLNSVPPLCRHTDKYMLMCWQGLKGEAHLLRSVMCHKVSPLSSVGPAMTSIIK